MVALMSPPLSSPVAPSDELAAADTGASFSQRGQKSLDFLRE